MTIHSLATKHWSRRRFIALSSLSALALPGIARGQQVDETPRLNQFLRETANSSLRGTLRTELPPLFITAYINPMYAVQAGQEAAVARYPLSLVPQDTRPAFKRWRDKVKSLNPKQIMLGYLSVNNEVFSPGPGHDVLNRARGEWARWPMGHVPTAFTPPRRLFDLRSPKWRDSFLEAARVTFASYPYDGLYLDNCSVFKITHPLESVREEMLASLQEALLLLRAEFPKIILIGNTRFNFEGLNGEMNENRFRELQKETEPFAGHVSPRLELHQSVLKAANDITTVEEELLGTLRVGGLYGAAVNYQQALWFDMFDEVLEAYAANG